jgi:hypothetical protein
MKIGKPEFARRKRSGTWAAWTAVALALAAGPVAGGVVMTCYSNSTGVAFSNSFPCSGSDLINQGQSTLDSSAQNPSSVSYSWDSLNNGNSVGYGRGNETPWTNTFTLNTNVNTLGYTITNIATFACWQGERASQKYELLLAFVDAPTNFVSYGTVAFYYKPGGNISTKVMLTGTAGAIANNVCAIRFAFSGKYEPDSGTIYQECDAFGYPSTTTGEAPVESMITGGSGPGGVGATNGDSALTLWVKADSLSLGDGEQVSSWPDNSGGAALPRAGTTSGYPAFTNGFLNGHPAIRFSGEAYFLRTNAAVAVHEIFAVARYTQATTFQSYDGLIMGNPWVAANYMLEGDTGSSRLTTFSGAYPAARRNGLGVTDADMSPINEAWIGAFTLSVDKTPPDISIGAFYTPDINRCWKGEIAEVATFRIDPPNAPSRSLNTLERSIVENYLSAKYGISLASGEDKYAGSSAYADGVFGIGQTNRANACLNGGSDGLGLQWYAGLHDGGYLFAGHNAGTNSVSGGRWTRLWYLDGTGLSGSEGLKLAFNWPHAGLGAADTSLATLLYSATGSGSFQSVAKGTYSGNTITFTVTASQLPDGYYTLGSQGQPRGTVISVR